MDRTALETVTIIEVAARAGVSKSTAARALAGYGSVSEKARTAVQTAAEELGYQPNALARSMITGRTMTLGVIIPDVSNHFFANAVRGISTISEGNVMPTSGGRPALWTPAVHPKSPALEIP